MALGVFALMGANFIADITMTTYQPDPTYTTGALGVIAGIIASLLAFAKSSNGDSNGSKKKEDSNDR